jgi:predicted transcriptional regulator
MTEDFTFEDILKEMHKLDEESPEGYTTYELSQKLNINQATIQKKIRRLIDKGILVYNGTKCHTKADNTLGYAPVYKLRD